MIREDDNNLSRDEEARRLLSLEHAHLFSSSHEGPDIDLEARRLSIGHPSEMSEDGGGMLRRETRVLRIHYSDERTSGESTGYDEPESNAEADG